MLEPGNIILLLEIFILNFLTIRCFTYISTMARCLNASQHLQVPFVILDRPNPIGCQETDVQGIIK